MCQNAKDLSMQTGYSWFMFILEYLQESSVTSCVCWTTSLWSGSFCMSNLDAAVGYQPSDVSSNILGEWLKYISVFQFFQSLLYWSHIFIMVKSNFASYCVRTSEKLLIVLPSLSYESGSWNKLLIRGWTMTLGSREYFVFGSTIAI